MPGIGLGNRHRVEISAQDPLARTRFLDFGNHRRQAGRNFRAQRPDEIAGLSGFFGAIAHYSNRAFMHCRSDFLMFDLEDFFQNIGHRRQAGFSFCVKAMNWSSLIFAAPLASTSSAL